MRETKDKKYGNRKENSLHPALEKYFDMKLNKTNEYYEFDYVNEEKKMLIELKSRRVHKTAYFDSMIGYNKVKKGFEKIKQGYQVYFLFGYEDYICLYELNKDTFNDKWVRDGGRSDRGRDEIKKYAYIPISQLINLFQIKKGAYIIIDNKNSIDFTKTMSNTEKPLSYTERLIKHFESNPLKFNPAEGEDIKLNITQITWVLNNFSLNEYEKRKNKTDEMPFGKYKFRKVKDVAGFDKQYLEWLVKQGMMSNYGALKEEILANI